MDEPKFLVDCMMGKVAKWLNFLGYDASFVTPEKRSQAGLLKAAKAEGRILLTRDADLEFAPGIKVLMLREQKFEDQLRKVFGVLKLKVVPEKLFKRCTLCNLELEKMTREEATPLVPEKVRTLDTEFSRCPGCRRIYWSGTHIENNLKKLKNLGLPGLPDTLAD